MKLILTNTCAIYNAEGSAYAVTLHQVGFDRFAVVYGQQIKTDLTYTEATKELGACLMHSLACDGRLDNRTKSEAKNDGDSKPMFQSWGE